MSSSGVISEDERPLKVLIAGGGIGGLSAAIFLRREGHQVEVRTAVGD
jgi:glycine/D-amino acid oxidase-like deaminating enzyme